METELIRIEPRLVHEVVNASGTSIKTKAVRQAIEKFLISRKRKGLKRHTSLRIFSLVS